MKKRVPLSIAFSPPRHFRPLKQVLQPGRGVHIEEYLRIRLNVSSIIHEIQELGG